MIILLIVCLLFALWLGVGYFGFRTAVCRGHELDIRDRESLRGTSWDKYYDEICAGMAWIESRPAEEVRIRSEDGLWLHGRLILHEEAKGTVLMFHGYRTHPEVDFSASAHVYYGCKNHILLIDQRAAGRSEGKYIGFGVLESRDCRCWAEYVRERFGGERRIILAGLSMGASTVLMAAARGLPENVCGIVADSAFSSPREIVQRRIQQSYHCRGGLIAAGIGFWCRLLAGYSLTEMSVPEVLRENEIPVLLAHGTADSVVPVEMTTKAAKNCRAPKQVLFVEGAEHGTGYLVENETYKKMLQEFCS